MPILPGDELSGDCQYVGNTPIQPHKASDGTLARATEADLDAVSDDVEVIRTGMVILSSRKQAYIDAFAALGLGVCDEDDAPFAAENAPLMIRFEPAGGLQVWLTGRDFTDYFPGSGPEYWQLAFDAVVAYAAAHVPASRTKVVVLLDTYTSDGTATTVLFDYFPACSTLPAGWTLHLLDEGESLATDNQVTDYFAGGGNALYGGPATPDETAVLIISGAYALDDTVTGLMATLAANASAIRAILQAGGGLMAWSQSFFGVDPTDTTRGDPMVVGWSWLDDVFTGIIPVGIDTFPLPWVATDEGETRCPGMTAAINDSSDTAQTAFSGAITSNGLAVMATTGSGVPLLGPNNGPFNIDIGGVPNF